MISKYSYNNTSSVIKSHKTICILLVLLIILSMILSGLVFDQLHKSDIKVKEFNYTIADKNYYKLCENLSDISDYNYNSLESSFYDSILNFKNELSSNKNFDYIVAINQFISAENINIPEQCLYGYESGTSKNSFSAKDGVTTSFVKSMQISNNFIDNYKIKLSQGRNFNDNEFNLNSNNTIPVILGNSYEASLNIGDKFKGSYLSKDFTFEVIGFIEKNSAYSFGESVNSCDRVILMPSFNVTDERSDFNKMLLIQQVNGIVVTKNDFESTNAMISKLLNDNNINNDIFLRAPHQSENILQTYKAMSNEIIKQFTILLIIVILFALFSLSTTINGFIEEKYYEFGILLLNGAKWNQLKLNIIFLIIKIVGLSSVISIIFLLLANKSLLSMLLVIVEALLITILSSIIPILHLKKMDINNIIGGKE